MFETDRVHEGLSDSRSGLNHVTAESSDCLEKEPTARYQSARDLAFQLRLVRHPSTPIAAPLVAGTRRRALVAALVGLIVLAATATLTWWLTRPGPPASPPTFRRLTFDSGADNGPGALAGRPAGRLCLRSIRRWQTWISGDKRWRPAKWLGLLEISVSPDKLLFNLGETTGNIWMGEWKP